jgi:hypothetical protein
MPKHIMEKDRTTHLDALRAEYMGRLPCYPTVLAVPKGTG